MEIENRFIRQPPAVSFLPARRIWSKLPALLLEEAQAVRLFHYSGHGHFGPDEEFEKRISGVMQSFEKQRYGDHRVREGNVLLSGCQSDQKAADAKFGKSYHGAFTFSWVKILRETKGRISHLELVQKLGDLLEDQGFKQVPQLECLEGREKAGLLTQF